MTCGIGLPDARQRHQVQVVENVRFNAAPLWPRKNPIAGESLLGGT